MAVCHSEVCNLNLIQLVIVREVSKFEHFQVQRLQVENFNFTALK